MYSDEKERHLCGDEDKGPSEHRLIKQSGDPNERSTDVQSTPAHKIGVRNPGVCNEVLQKTHADLLQGEDERPRPQPRHLFDGSPKASARKPSSDKSWRGLDISSDIAPCDMTPCPRQLSRVTLKAVDTEANRRWLDGWMTSMKERTGCPWGA